MDSEKAIEKVFFAIGESEEELIQTLQQLVRTPSLVGHEGQAQAFMEAKFKELGLTVETFEADAEQLKKHPAYIDIPGDYAGRPNVVGTLQGSGDHRSLKLNGHVDVVSPEPLDQWTFDPWGGEIDGGKLYGRGAVDMKAGVIANLFALKAILKSGIKPRGTVILESVIEEEAGGSGGALACFMKGYKADGMLVPEPSDLSVVTSHTGIKYFRVRVVGKTAHAALSHTGVNAIGKMNQIYDALIRLDAKRAAEHSYPLVESWGGRSCNLNIGTYAAGDWASSVAGMATMECRVGFVPGENGDEVVREVEQTIRDVAAADPWLKEHPPTVQWYGWDTEAWLQDENAPLVQAFLESSTPVVGERPTVRGMTGAMDTRFAPYFGTPSFSFGPSGERYHGPDEYVDLQSVLTVTRAIAKFVLDWCGYE